MSARLAALASGGGVHIDLDGAALIGSTSIPMTGDWQSWTTTSLGAVPITAGQHVLTIHIDNGEFNINWLEFTAQE